MRVLAMLALVGCGHTFAASLGATRRNGVTGLLATVGADMHVISDGDGQAVYVPVGVRAGAAIDRDGVRGMLVLDIGLGRVPVDRGWTARADLSCGTSIGGDVTAGIGWGRADDASLPWGTFFDAHARPVRFVALGVAAGAETSLVDHADSLDASLAVAWGTTTSSYQAHAAN